MSHSVVAEPCAGGVTELVVSQAWKDKAAYEAWMNTPVRRRSHLPPTVWQFRPANKYSVPEEFSPFVREDGK